MAFKHNKFKLNISTKIFNQNKVFMVPTAFEQSGVWEEAIVNSIIRCMQGYPEATFLGKSCEDFKDSFIATRYL